MAADPTVHKHVLYVTGPQREQLYEHFRSLFRGRGDVEVRIDRRVAERRRNPAGRSGGERRLRERRLNPPVWMVPPRDSG
jgi:hypothetical protein